MYSAQCSLFSACCASLESSEFGTAPSPTRRFVWPGGRFERAALLNLPGAVKASGLLLKDHSMAFGRLGALGRGFGALGSGLLGSASGSVPSISAPVLAMHPSWVTTDNEPDFTITVDDTVEAGDDVRLQVQVSGGDWSSPVSDTTHDITAPEDAADEIDLALAALSNANYEARANVTDGVVTSNWSNTVSFTVAASAPPSAGLNVYPYLLV